MKSYLIRLVAFLIVAMFTIPTLKFFSHGADLPWYVIAWSALICDVISTSWLKYSRLDK